MREKTREMIKSALFEASFVVLGVVLALAANEWRQKLADEHAVKHAVTSIVIEIENNLAQVESSLAYHRNLLNIIREASKSGELPKLQDFNRGFVSPAQVSKTAWQTASETGVLSKADFQVILDLSKAYDKQERYQFQVNGMSQVIYTQLFNGGTDSILANYNNLASIIASFSYTEYALTEVYKDTLKQFQEYTETSSSTNDEVD